MITRLPTSYHRAHVQADDAPQLPQQTHFLPASECSMITLQGVLRVLSLSSNACQYLLLLSMPSVSSAPFSGDPKQSTKVEHAGVPLQSPKLGVCLVRRAKTVGIITARKEAPFSPERLLCLTVGWPSEVLLRTMVKAVSLIYPDFSIQQGPSGVHGPQMLSNLV